jgi:hypothetical protein
VHSWFSAKDIDFRYGMHLDCLVGARGSTIILSVPRRFKIPLVYADMPVPGFPAIFARVRSGWEKTTHEVEKCVWVGMHEITSFDAVMYVLAISENPRRCLSSEGT